MSSSVTKMMLANLKVKKDDKQIQKKKKVNTERLSYLERLSMEKNANFLEESVKRMKKSDASKTSSLAEEVRRRILKDNRRRRNRRMKDSALSVMKSMVNQQMDLDGHKSFFDEEGEENEDDDEREDEENDEEED
eukprot:TRINITY_DN3978_c0_g1_i1.p1 TRINITY_DN3978_c0_g1~~TRINITY_DN3978_c0_g1_i1.p1  ORF type:complete len:135 (+),score=72.02 TRINITY_DN3978_c0_g1_i1:45-449(+)